MTDTYILAIFIIYSIFLVISYIVYIVAAAKIRSVDQVELQGSFISAACIFAFVALIAIAAIAA